MGLFDYVKSEYPLPGCEDAREVKFQTKDTDAQYMQTYKLTKEGRLLHQDVRYEDRSDPNAAPGSFASIRGCATPVPIGWTDTNFHGDLTFYAGDFEYTALFKDGQLIDIRRIEGGVMKGEIIEFEGKQWKRTGLDRPPKKDEVFIGLVGNPSRAAMDYPQHTGASREILREVPAPEPAAPDAVRELAAKIMQYDTSRDHAEGLIRNEIREALAPLLQKAEAAVNSRNSKADQEFAVERARWESKP